MSVGVIPLERIRQLILLVRGQKVMLDRDLAVLYGVETRALNQAVKRNRDRFPSDSAHIPRSSAAGIQNRRNEALPGYPDACTGEFGRLHFMFQLTREEIRNISQFVISSADLKFSKSVYAFTEQGVAMLSGVLNSPCAVQVNVAIMRTFVQLRQLLATHADLARKLEELEKKYDSQFRVVFDAIRQFMTPPDPPRKQIGFHVRESGTKYGIRRKEK